MNKLRLSTEQLLLKAEKKYQSVNWENVLVIFLSTFVWGIIAHGYMLFNKFSWGDDITNLYFFGTTYELGRWALEILRKIFIFFFETNASQPFVNGMGCFICISVAACLLSDLLHLKKKSSLIALSGAMVTIPTLITMFSFMFTSFPYMIGMMLGVLGVWCVCKGKLQPIRFIVGALLISFSIGVYQAWFPMALSVLLLSFIIDVLNNRFDGWKAYWIRVIYYLAVCAAALLSYLAINEYFLLTKEIVMNDHAGMDNYGMVTVSEYIQRVLYAYRMFFRPDRGFYPSFISKVYKLLLLWAAILTIYHLVKRFRQNISKGLQMLFPLVLMPLAVCFIYVLSAGANALVLYPYVVVYAYFIWLIEDKLNETDIISVWRQRTGIIFILCMSIWFCRYSNVSYFKADLLHQRATSYYTTLITRIQSTEGYHEELPIAYVNANQNISLETVTLTSDLDTACVLPNTFLHDYSWKAFIQEICGFSQQEVDSAKLSEVTNWEKVQNMPAYPNDGSIQVINDVIVVKISASN